MTSTTTKPDCLQPAADMAGDLFDDWFDPLEAEVRARSREFIEELLRGELVELFREMNKRDAFYAERSTVDLGAYRLSKAHCRRGRCPRDEIPPSHVSLPPKDHANGIGRLSKVQSVDQRMRLGMRGWL